MFGLRRHNIPVSRIETASPSLPHHDAGEGLVRISARSLISLRHTAESIPLEVGKVRAAQSGHYHSPFKGRGMEFDEARLYQPGDDVRSIDWRVTARTGKPHTKLYREERERAVMLCVDYRASMFFATRGSFKSVLAAKISSLFSWSASNNGDRLGGLIFSEALCQEIRPQRGKGAVLHFLQRLADHPAWKDVETSAAASRHADQLTSNAEVDSQNQNQSENQSEANESIQQALVRLRRVTRPGSLLVLVSDFRGLDKQSQAHLGHLSRHNDIVLVFVYDKLESELPPSGYYRLGHNSERASIDTGVKKTRQQYHARFQDRLTKIENLCTRYRMSYITCATDDNVVEKLQLGLGLKVRR